MATRHRRRACGSAPGSVRPELFIALLHSPLRIFYKCKVPCLPVGAVRLASHPKGEHRLTVADATEASQVNTLSDDGWWWRVSLPHSGREATERAPTVWPRRLGPIRRRPRFGPESGTSCPHPGIRTASHSGGRAVSVVVPAGPVPGEEIILRPAADVAFRAIRYTRANVQSRSVFTFAGGGRRPAWSTWR
ncbi:Protein of unknown function [Micromonospora lupini str. Lupac 08]|uniref:Uncharacterized protein n=1 Tax=Micromonospora lupini str. Lupac 08 TaxID=1150864 RepID=I0LEV3_9ACTN|nr:Protein of unknown function [Micromonospora lupini str. Lupac 08]